MYLEFGDDYDRQVRDLKARSRDLCKAVVELEAAARHLVSALGQVYEQDALAVWKERGIERIQVVKQTYVCSVVRVRGNPLEIELRFASDRSPFVVAERISEQQPRLKIRVVG